MKFKDAIFSKVILKSLFVIFIFLLLFISSITYKNSLQFTDSTKWVIHSYKVHSELDNLMLILKDAETGQRGFLLTHDTTYLSPYFRSKIKARESVNKLRKLFSTNLNQQKNMERLSELTELRFAYLRYAMYQDSIGSKNKTNIRSGLDNGRLIMDTVRSQSIKMQKIEKQYLIKRSESYISKISEIPLLILLITLFSLAIFIIAYIKINKDLSILEQANKQLLITNESSVQAEKIADFSTWTCDLETNTFSFSDNFYCLLGCKPNAFEPSVSNFVKYVYPEDKRKVLAIRKKVLKEEKTLIHFFRIIREDEQLRYFKLIAKTVVHLKGEKTIIGIISDITDEHNKNITIQKRNFELEQTNTELESFNHVASHDLQEPLRKIQLFISRISNADLEVISETGKEYIAKIHLATSKMRTLIDDLLLFSRTNKTDKVFIKTDLNELLENAKQELADTILEKNATLITEELPVIEVIPYQIQQLFINLISNSLKYSKADTSPIISIRCEKILVSQVSFLKTNPDKEYYKISISDNGLGFDQQFSESIFTLFNRLHSISEFPGTGIGLAICKKIVENHMGAIKAEGKLDIGTIFTIFLPE
ncbi:MAG: CHASE3 domain-containing protein [Flavobacterium sp.]|uniref:sensor histidine kinase n=1 Tax=Flavobacterium sp. TaxID=239 RepID=UPI003266B940